MNKTDQILIRRQTLLDFISAFDSDTGCRWPMNKIMVALNCTKRQLRDDINFLLQKDILQSTVKHIGNKLTRTLYSNMDSDYAIPTLTKNKVYTTQPTTAFDLTADDYVDGAMTATQYHGKWKYEYSNEATTEKGTVLSTTRPTDAALAATLHDIEHLTKSQLRAKYGNKYAQEGVMYRHNRQSAKGHSI